MKKTAATGFQGATMKKTAATGLTIVMLAICGLASSTSTREGGPPPFDEAISRPVTLARQSELIEAISRAFTIARQSELIEAISRAFTISPCLWDLDGSRDVGIVDFLALLAAWGTDPGGPPDFNGDGNVGIEDFLELLANWGPCL